MGFAIAIVLLMVAGLVMACDSTSAVLENNNAPMDDPDISNVTLEVSTIY